MYATFTHSNGKYKGKYKERFGTLENLDGFKETNQLEQAENAEVTNVKVEEKRQYAPKLFSLSDLQSFANKRFKYSADKTLSIAQKLYEKKVLSYPRSDTNYIGSPEFDYLKSNLSRYLELVGVGISEPQLNENKRYVDGSKVQEHYAIIPTKTLPKLSDVTKDEKNIYLLVLYRTSQFLKSRISMTKPPLIQRSIRFCSNQKGRQKKSVDGNDYINRKKKTSTTHFYQK